MADPVSLADAAANEATISAALTTALAGDGITLDALSITLGGASEAVTFNASQETVDMPGGWRGRGHLTGDPVNYLRGMARARFGLDT